MIAHGSTSHGSCPRLRASWGRLPVLLASGRASSGGPSPLMGTREGREGLSAEPRSRGHAPRQRASEPRSCAGGSRSCTALASWISANTLGRSRRNGASTAGPRRAPERRSATVVPPRRREERASDTASFQRWATWLFGHPLGRTIFEIAGDAPRDRVPVAIRVARLGWLFENAGLFAATPAPQVGQAVWFLASEGESELQVLRKGTVAAPSRARVAAQIALLFERLLSRVCRPKLAHIDAVDEGPS